MAKRLESVGIHTDSGFCSVVTAVMYVGVVGCRGSIPTISCRSPVTGIVTAVSGPSDRCARDVPRKLFAVNRASLSLAHLDYEVNDNGYYDKRPVIVLETARDWYDRP